MRVRLDHRPRPCPRVLRLPSSPHREHGAGGRSTRGSIVPALVRSRVRRLCLEELPLRQRDAEPAPPLPSHGKGRRTPSYTRVLPPHRDYGRCCSLPPAPVMRSHFPLSYWTVQLVYRCKSFIGVIEGFHLIANNSCRLCCTGMGTDETCRSGQSSPDTGHCSHQLSGLDRSLCYTG